MKTMAFAAAVAMATPVSAAGVLPYDDAERVANGLTVYQENCAACHQVDLTGEQNWKSPGEDGLMPAPPHDVSGHTWHHDDFLLLQIVALGTELVVGGDYKSRMPGFGQVLTPDEIMNVLAYIKSTWPNEVIELHNDINMRRGVGRK
ncbi:c-type cytochrome [Pseudoprimorskyibacter insulae]|uniref:Cytochrome c6 n=1 Tax=Pseudoprimorskyibacter insulae TaxID=1695997 RepID=A0A2R8AUU0_9RHOB|nr:cytochrome c [Pseudoprimorskyibacter insulae]SPF79697.1 Cytochrome c6 [Pseudoprimorskyibacter insulae]